MDVHDAAFKCAQKIALQYAHETGQHDQIHFRRLQSVHKCALRLLVQLGAEFSRRDELRRDFPFARVGQNSGVSTSLMTIAASAGIFPAANASAMATKFEPLPEPSTPNRNG